jgi:hypothetical protein
VGVRCERCRHQDAPRAHKVLSAPPESSVRSWATSGSRFTLRCRIRPVEAHFVIYCIAGMRVDYGGASTRPPGATRSAWQQARRDDPNNVVRQNSKSVASVKKGALRNAVVCKTTEGTATAKR